MSLDRIIATGRGKLQARAEIEGWPVQPVTCEAMEQDVGDGRVRGVGLKIQGLNIAARLNLPEGKVEAKGMTITVEGTRRALVAVSSFRRKPTLTTYLSAYVSSSAGTIPVFSTDGWPSEGVLHLNTEAIHYTGKTATTFTGCTRGYWWTEPQAHFVAGGGSFESEGAAIAYPPVTDWPLSIEGRRVRVFLYGEGNGLGGDGVQRWIGTATRCGRFEGARVTIGVDALTSVLKQQIGGDAARKIPIRGIYYPWSAPFLFAMTLCNSTGSMDPSSTTVLIKLPGFFETWAAFCTALSAEIATATAGWAWAPGSAIYAEPVPGGFQLVYLTGTGGAGPKYVDFGDRATHPDARRVTLYMTDVSGGAVAHDVLLDQLWVQDGTSPAATAFVAASQRYVARFASPFPRAYFGDATPWTEFDDGRGVLTSPTLASTWPGTRIYFGGLVALSSDTLVGWEPGEGVTRLSSAGATTTIESDEVSMANVQRVYSFDAATRSARIGASEDIAIFLKIGPAARFRLGRELARGNVGDLITFLRLSSADYANAGAMPLVRASDMNVPSSEVDAALTSRMVSDRAFVAMGQDVTLEELVGAELAAAGLHWRFATDGTITVRRIRLAASTDPATTHVVQDSTVGGLPTIEEAATWGFVNLLKVLTGYDPIEDEHLGAEHHVPNVQASAPNRASKSFEIAQKSIARGAEPTVEDVVRVARLWLGLLGGTYDILSIPVTMKAFNTLLGDAVQVTSPYVMGDDGRMGITAKVGLCIGYDWDVETGRGALEVLMHRRNIAGYAPGFRVSGQANVGGNKWDVTLNVAELTDQALSTWYAAGDKVRVIEQDSTAPTELDGTIESITGNVARVDFTGVWTPGALEWALEPQVSDQHDFASNLGRFVFVGGPTGLVGYSDGNQPARVFSP